MSIDQQQHVALPKLYGAPAYARPPKVAEEGPRPFDPDELPIEASMSDDEREFAASLPARVYTPGATYVDGSHASEHGSDGLRPRAMSVRSIAGRLIRKRRSPR